MENFTSKNNRNEKNPPHKKHFDFKLCKNNTIKSLNEVEYFLNNLQKFSKCLKISKIFK